ncbi:MAG: nitroreductase family protein [Promethearchaeota archaeon]
MRFSKTISNVVKERTSWRTYSSEILKDDVKDVILKLLKMDDFDSPFRKFTGEIRFELLNLTEFDPSEKQKIGTYGAIEGVQNFIVGAVEKSEYDQEHFGYAMELIILTVTDLGLGTCWLGGTFNRSLFAAKIKKSEKEIVPAITPIGYPATRTEKEKTIRSYARADKRFPWNKLFFENDFSTPLSEERAEIYFPLIENVRLGPSAGNFQPWRILKEANKDNYHFYVLYMNDQIGKMYNVFKRLDIGIAVSHFDLTARELGIKGEWRFEQPGIPKVEDLHYTISWIGEI